jgi:hypothetical protein
MREGGKKKGKEEGGGGGGWGVCCAYEILKGFALCTFFKGLNT